MTTLDVLAPADVLPPEPPAIDLNALVTVTYPTGRQILARTARAWTGDGSVCLWVWGRARAATQAVAWAEDVPRDWVAPYRTWKPARGPERVPDIPEYDGLVLKGKERQ